MPTNALFSARILGFRSCGGEGSALRYHAELVAENCPDSFLTEIVKVSGLEYRTPTAGDVVDSASSQDKAKQHEAAMVLKNLLRDGRKSAMECAATLQAERYDLEKLNPYRIRKKAGVDRKKFPDDKFYGWYLPSPAWCPSCTRAVRSRVCISVFQPRFKSIYIVVFQAGIHGIRGPPRTRPRPAQHHISAFPLAFEDCVCSRYYGAVNDADN